MKLNYTKFRLLVSLLVISFVCSSVQSIPSINFASESKPFSTGGTDYGYKLIESRMGKAYTDVYKTLVAQCEKFYQDRVTNVPKGSNGYYMLEPVNVDALNLNYSEKAALEDFFFLFKSDNPKYYFVEMFIIWSYENAHITSIQIYINPAYANGAVRDRAKGLIERGFDEYKTLSAGLTDPYDIARVVKEKMNAEHDFSIINGKPDNNAYAHNLMGVFDKSTKGPVCESSAKAYMYILNRLGIETLFFWGSHAFQLSINTSSEEITYNYGSSKQTLSFHGVQMKHSAKPSIFDLAAYIPNSHAWNLMKLSDGRFYFMDPTDTEFTARADGSIRDPDPFNLRNSYNYQAFLIGSVEMASLGYHSVYEYDKSIKSFGYPTPANFSVQSYKPNTQFRYLTTDTRYEKSTTSISTYNGNSAQGVYLGKSLEFLKVTYTSENGQITTLTRNVDYTIRTEDAAGTGYNRVYVIGKGLYRGVMMGYSD